MRKPADSQFSCSQCRYQAIVDLTRRLNSKFGSPQETTSRTQGILRSLFPPWLPAAFKVCLAFTPDLLGVRGQVQAAGPACLNRITSACNAFRSCLLWRGIPCMQSMCSSTRPVLDACQVRRSCSLGLCQASPAA